MGILARSPQPRIGAAAVEDPVQEGKGQDRVQPDTEADAEKVAGAVGLRAALHEIDDEPGGNPGCFGDQYHHERKRQRPDHG